MVSVVIAHKEDRGFLDEAIESVENQTYQDFEIILQKGDHLRGKNVNDGVMRARGKFIKLLDDDDTLTPESLECLVHGIEGWDWVCAKAHSIPGEDYIEKPGNLNDNIKVNTIHGGTTMYRKSLFYDTGGFDESLITAEEYDFHLLLMQSGYKLGWVDAFVHNYRIWGGNKSMNFPPEAKRELVEQVKDRYR